VKGGSEWAGEKKKGRENEDEEKREKETDGQTGSQKTKQNIILP
jgi:hypothetical protein